MERCKYGRQQLGKNLHLVVLADPLGPLGDFENGLRAGEDVGEFELLDFELFDDGRLDAEVAVAVLATVFDARFCFCH